MKFSTAIEEIRTSIDTLFSARTELPNPYDVSDNPEPMMRNGWGIVVGGNLELNQATVSTVVDHDFGVVVVKELVKTDNNPDPVFELGKSLYLDGLNIRKDLLCKDITGVSKLVHTSTSAPELVTEGRYLSITVNFTATIFESL